jgi:hypothetical protein
MAGRAPGDALAAVPADSVKAIIVTVETVAEKNNWGLITHVVPNANQA